MATTVTDEFLVEWDFPPRGPVLVKVKVLRQERHRAVVRVTGSAENGCPEVLRVDPANLVESQGETLIEGELLEGHRQPGRWLEMYISGQVRVAGLRRRLTVPIKSLAAA